MAHCWVWNIVLNVLTYGMLIQTLQITSKSSYEGIVGNNTLNLLCSYQLTAQENVVDVKFSFKNSSSQQFINLVDMYIGREPFFYLSFLDLKNRTVLTTPSRTNASILFEILKCSDKGEYKCEVTARAITGSSTNYSITRLLPTAPASRPSTITLFGIDRTMERSIEITTESNNRSNPETSFPHLKPDNYIDDQTYVEGDNLTIFCSGEVAKPSENLTVHMIQRANTSKILTLDYDSENTDSGHCSFNQNKSFTTTLTAEDNGAIFRCAVSSLILIDDMFIQTTPIDVQYPVNTPVIKAYPNQRQHPPVMLSCHGSGNPKPKYTWYRVFNTNDTMSVHIIGDSQNITLSNISDSGEYKCEISNAIGQKVFRENSTYTVKFSETSTSAAYMTSLNAVNSTTHDYTKPSTTDTPNNPVKSKNGKYHNKIELVIGIVVGVIVLLFIIIVITVLVKCHANRKSKNSPGLYESDSRLVHQMPTRQTMGADNYISVSFANNGGDQIPFTEVCSPHKEKYLKEQQEVKARNKGHQPVEYAMVNKPFKDWSSEKQVDQHQPTEYAQVNKVQKIPTSEPPQDEDPYASGQGVYDHTNNRRHKQPTESDLYDISTNMSRRRSDKVGSVVENTGEPTKQKQVAKVKPSGRTCYENAGIVPDNVIKKKEEPNTEL